MLFPYAKFIRGGSFTGIEDLGSTRQHDVKVVNIFIIDMYYFARYLGVGFSIIYLDNLEFDPHDWLWSDTLDFLVY
jgi:hypothetical protein